MALHRTHQQWAVPVTCFFTAQLQGLLSGGRQCFFSLLLMRDTRFPASLLQGHYAGQVMVTWADFSRQKFTSTKKTIIITTKQLCKDNCLFKYLESEELNKHEQKWDNNACIKLVLLNTFTFSHLADAFIQSDWKIMTISDQNNKRAII